MHRREPQDIDGPFFFRARPHFLFDPKRRRRKSGLETSQKPAAVHRVHRPRTIRAVRDPLHIVADKAHAAIRFHKDPLRCRILPDEIQSGQEIFLRPVDQRLRARLRAMETMRRHRIFVVHVFHRVEIAPKRPIDERETSRNRVEKRRRARQCARASVPTRRLPFTP